MVAWESKWGKLPGDIITIPDPDKGTETTVNLQEEILKLFEQLLTEETPEAKKFFSE